MPFSGYIWFFFVILVDKRKWSGSGAKWHRRALFCNTATHFKIFITATHFVIKRHQKVFASQQKHPSMLRCLVWRRHFFGTKPLFRGIPKTVGLLLGHCMHNIRTRVLSPLGRWSFCWLRCFFLKLFGACFRADGGTRAHSANIHKQRRKCEYLAGKHMTKASNTGA